VKVVHFRHLEKPKDDEFCLELSRQHTYDDVVERVALQVGLEDASKIRLTSHNCYLQQPKPQPIKYRGVERLTDMLVHYNQTSDILYFETLDLPLPELQGLKTLKIAFHNSKTEEVSVHNIRLPKQCTVGDVIHELKGKVFLLPGCGVVHLSVNLTSLGFYASLEVVLLKGVLLGSGLIYRLNYLVQMQS
jgi:ubiquitin carboxyl-terminal hydrolase 7